MSKKCIEEFNPWPPFVDIFSSTILVLLLFILILVVNLGYYAQFKFKVSYTGTISTDQIILNDNPSKVKVDKVPVENKDDTTIQEKQMPKKIIVEEKVKAEPVPVKPKDENTTTVFELERAGQDLKQFDDQESTLQSTLQKDDYLVVNFADKEIILDDLIIKQIKEYIAKIKKKYPNHRVLVSSVDPLNQISATIAKQISLARTLNTRNLIRKLDYKKSDVRVRLLDEKIKEKLPENKSGYIYITVKAK